MIDAALIEEAKCYLCLGISLPDALKMALLARIAAGGGSGAAQTPWASDIDGGGFSLSNVVDVTATTFNGVKVYRALVTQGGVLAPTAVILENTLGAVPAWSYVGVGSYALTLAGAFPVAKTFVLSANMSVDPLVSTAWMSPTVSGSGDEVDFFVTQIDYDGGFNSGGPADGLLLATAIQILVYP